MSDNITIKRTTPYLPVRSCLFRILPLNPKGQRSSSAHGPLVARMYRNENELENNGKADVVKREYDRNSKITMNIGKRRTSDSKMIEAT